MLAVLVRDDVWVEDPDEGKLWQKSSYDRVLDMEKPFEEIVQYTVENPVRKELIGDWEDWPYSGIVDPWWE